MKYDAGVSATKSAALNEAISVAHFINLPAVDDYGQPNQLLALMKTNDLSPDTLHKWLEDRVTYVVDQGFDMNSHGSLIGNNVTYPDPAVVPDAIIALRATSPQNSIGLNDDSKIQTIMLNIGGGLYFGGKQAQKIVEMNLDGVGRVDFSSPRVGLLQIGEGMFPDLAGKRVQNILLDIFRAGILFHEARHSDGHGLTLGFFHAICPSGDYKGMPACDAATNGPYTIGSEMMKQLRANCGSNCTALTLNVLQTLYFDQASRQLYSYDLPNTSKGAAAGTVWDDAPEKVIGQ